MEIRLQQPVKAQLTPNLPFTGAPAGAFTYYTVAETGNQERGLIYVCPCGCGRQGNLAFKPLTEDDIKYNRATWDWDGNRESPTLSPSIHHVGHWHGWLRNGFFTQA